MRSADGTKARRCIRGRWIPGVVVSLTIAAGTSAAQTPTDGRQSPCLRFAFGAWQPPLDWEGSGHSGNAGASGEAVRRLRDSIFLQQPGADPRDGMVWDEKSNGSRVYLFPAWWPAGVIIQFDSASLAGDTLRGVAVAMVADAATKGSTSRVRALRVRCGGSR
jgi:hypothetical protein